ncbi:hypothetical protein ACE1ET_13275 [Saccharicrinis sp. FJH62]|uniref:hypothetical protein n=1 Tax=Saccharicrinis sp. FJH62 TaxID=3344657 RepID=UPI0035D4BFF3
MKKVKRILSVLVLSLIVLPGLTAQEFSTGLDIYSSYIWRGSKFGTGAAFQPYVEFSAGDFALGAWGSVSTGGWDGTFEADDAGMITSFTGSEGFEMDLYASYSFGPVSLTVTDYYFGGDWTDYSAAGGYHYIEPMIGVGVGDLSLTGAYMFAPGFEAGDTYVEAAYAFGSFDLTLGAGDGAYTSDGSFTVCNIAVGTSKEVKITDSFSLPVSGAVILNPSTGGFFITVGISL